jgi:hypothetical protein
MPDSLNLWHIHEVSLKSIGKNKIMKIDTLTREEERLGLFYVLMTKSLTSHCSLPSLDAHAEKTRHWIILVHFHFHFHSRSLLLPFPFLPYPGSLFGCKASWFRDEA